MRTRAHAHTPIETLEFTSHIYSYIHIILRKFAGMQTRCRSLFVHSFMGQAGMACAQMPDMPNKCDFAQSADQCSRLT